MQLDWETVRFDGCDVTVRPFDLVVGGIVEPGDLVGRERELVLVQQGVTTAFGVVLVGDRRMGKTSLLRALEQQWQQAGHTVVFVSAQTRDPQVLGDRLRERLAPTTWFTRERKRWSLNVRVGAKGITLERRGGAGEQPDDVDLLAWAAEQSAPNRLIVMIDELTILLKSMCANPDDAGEFLHHLRRARQEHSNLTIVLAGSIGLHHVIPPGSGAVNDLQRVMVGAVSPCAALELAVGLLAGVGIDSADRGAAEHIARAAAGIPFYIHWLVQQVSLDHDVRRPPLDRLRAAAADPLDPLDFRHYRDRLPEYYGAEAPLAERMLDHVAMEGIVGVDSLLHLLAADSFTRRPTRGEVILLLEGLERDNYLLRTDEGENRFASDVLALAWRTIQRL